MTVSATTNRASYSGNGVTVAFPFPYPFIADADIVVIQKNNTTGVETVKTLIAPFTLTGFETIPFLTPLYTLTGAGLPGGGTITFFIAPPAGTSIIIYRDVSPLQSLDLVENSRLPAESVEASFDKLTMIAQRVYELVNRSLRLRDGYTAAFDMRMPPTLLPDTVLAINSTGDGWVQGPTLVEIINLVEQAGSDAADAAASAAAALASQGAAAASAVAAAASDASAAAIYDSFDDRYLGAKASAPTTDNDGNTLIVGALYFDSVLHNMYAWDGTIWKLMGGGGGISLWLTATAYLVDNVIHINNKIYKCLTGHTSGTFATDLAAGKWQSLSIGDVKIFGTKASPILIGVGGITFASTYYENIMFIQSTGGAIDITANPQITAPTLVGQKLKLVGCSATDTVQIDDGTGVSIRGPWLSDNGNVLNYYADSALLWCEDNRSL